MDIQKYLVPNYPTSKSSIEGVVDEDRSFNHHEEVTDGQVHHKDIGRSLQGLGAEGNLIVILNISWDHNTDP